MFDMASKRKAMDSPGTPSKRASKILTLAEKVQFLDAVNSGKSHRSVALLFRFGCTQINHIV